MSESNTIKNLIKNFDKDLIKHIKSSSTYNETDVRVEYIDVMFGLLGWDMSNSGGVKASLRDVLREESQKTETTTKKPDYTFRISANRKYYVEAKRPSVDIRTDPKSAFQTRSYGYTAGLTISVLTNFRSLRIYDTRIAPSINDDSDVGLLFSYDFEDYESKFDEIKSLLGRDEVSLGSIEAKIGEAPSGTIPANESFLAKINSWRLMIARDLKGRYSTLSIDELSDFAQKIINRIIFIRMCEDRGIEGENTLKNSAKKKSLIELRSLFKTLDDRYNTGLFDVNKDRLYDTYELDSELFLNIIDEVYTPKSPYSFSVLDSDFLGQVYELFLTERLTIISGVVQLETKPAYVHREIVTTPQILVDEIVRRSINQYCSQKTSPVTLEDILRIKILDIAVGSGRFLFRTFNEIVSIAIDTINNSEDRSMVYCINGTDYRLDFDIKKRIIENCLYGIDIDYNAVEATRFGLLILLLEDEKGETLPSGNKILPDLDIRIIHGNTIVETDFTSSSDEVENATAPLDWNLSNLPKAFDVVVGNPPYVKTEEMKNETKEEYDYYKKIKKYKTAYKQFDKYFLFIEVALKKINENAVIGLIIPNKWMTIESGKKVREIIAQNNYTSQIVDFGNELVFKGKSAYVCILVLSKSKNNEFTYRYVSSYDEFLKDPQKKGYLLPSDVITNQGNNSWILPANENEKTVISKLLNNSVPLSKVSQIKNGIQTSANDVFLISNYKINNGLVIFEQNGKQWSIEKNITRPYIEDSTKVISYKEVNADSLMIFPYELDQNKKPKAISLKRMNTDFPNAMKYIESHRERLLERKVSPPQENGVFYAYGRHQALESVFSSPKIIYSVNQKGEKYGYDLKGITHASGGTAGEVAILNFKRGYSLEFILGLLNQRPIEFFLEKRGSPFGGGWFSRGSGVIKNTPVPFLDIENNDDDRIIHDRITSLVKDIINNEKRKESASGRGIEKTNATLLKLKASLENQFNSLWGFSNEPRNLSLPSEK